MPAFKPYPFAFINNTIKPIEEATISIMTNALHYGAGIFGGLKAYDTAKGMGIFRLDDHVSRMWSSAKILRLPYAFDKKTVSQQITDLAIKNKLKGKTYIRPLLYRSDTQLSPGIAGEYDLAIYMLEMTTDYLASADGLSVCVSSWQRNSENALPPRTKATGGYLNSALAIHDAKQSGYDSAIMLNQHGEVGEGAVMNLFVVKNGVLVTPSMEADILEGITRRTVMELARELGIDVQERTVSRSELYGADELFFCGTAVEISWCKTVDKVEISPQAGPITSKLMRAFAELPQTHPHLFTLLA
ncbi:MAG TPA: branched-chain amino acid transaminase [Candidatus Limnocylindrales bacterium]|nr:branched-chain amino acid transaminase [Candidatus Limnocylindrales bacterium]